MYDPFKVISQTNQFNLYDPNFHWDRLAEIDIVTIVREITDENVYEIYHEVQEDDIVVDIGASVGPFVCSAFLKNPAKVIAVEPSLNLSNALWTNVNHYYPSMLGRLFLANTGIVDQSNTDVRMFGGDSSYNTCTFAQFIKAADIDHIDFLKIDCEGGEYAIFSEENIDFLMYNVGYIAAEFHLRLPTGVEQFKRFKDEFLPRFRHYKIMSCTRQPFNFGTAIDLSTYLLNDIAIATYPHEIMVYLKN